jgi:hypothetical protein
MLTIRREQIETLNADLRRRFETRMVAHVNQFFRQRCELLGEGGVREWIVAGIERAAGYGIKAEVDVCRYIDVMFVFGRGFDTDPRYPWAARILNARAANPRARVDHLVKSAKKRIPLGGYDRV